MKYGKSYGKKTKSTKKTKSKKVVKTKKKKGY